MRLKFEPHPEHKIGEGTQKRAYHNPEDPQDEETVLLEFKHVEQAEAMKAMFYYQKIAHLLFPAFTVDVKQVGRVEGEEGGVSYARTEYVSPGDDAQHVQVQAALAPTEGHYNEEVAEEAQGVLDDALADMESRPDIQAFLRRYYQSGLYNRLAAWGPQDLIMQGERKFKFIDIAPPFYIDPEHPEEKELLFQPTKLKRAIMKLPEDRRQQALRYYDRLVQLCREAGFAV